VCARARVSMRGPGRSRAGEVTDRASEGLRFLGFHPDLSLGFSLVSLVSLV